MELHPDNGSEFLNDHLVRFWGEAITGLRLSRSRPYKKNDHRFVEQKNDSLVRAYVGHGRLDTPAHATALNALYDQMWIYYNLFQPVLHLVEKTIDPANPTRGRRKWDDAHPPFARLCATEARTQTCRTELERLREHTNPRVLRQDIYATLDHLLTSRSRLNVPLEETAA